MNIANAEDAYLSGSADFQEWQDQFMAEWFRPLTNTMIALLMASITPEVQEQLRAMSPEAFDVFSSMAGGNNASTIQKSSKIPPGTRRT